MNRLHTYLYIRNCMKYKSTPTVNNGTNLAIFAINLKNGFRLLLLIRLPQHLHNQLNERALTI